MFILDIVVLLGSLILLGLVSNKAVQYVEALSEVLGMSEMAAGFILLSVSTSLPELSVSIIASSIGEGGLSLGNVLGSNIANLTIIMGLAILLSKTVIAVNQESQKELIQFLFISSVIPLFVVQRGSLSLALAVVLLILFAYFSVTVSKGAKKATGLQKVNRKDKVVLCLKFLITIALVIIVSKFTVDSGVSIAKAFEVPPSIIGATIVALGTSLPELATTTQAFKKGFLNMGLGNLLGSCITNVTLILGTSSLISFSEVNVAAAGSLMFFVLISTLTIWYILNTRKSLDRKVCYVLLGIYGMYILQELGLSIFIL